MKALRFLAAISILCLVCTTRSYGNGVAANSDGRTKTSATSLIGEARCTIVQRGPAPLSAVLEDALAYALDIPLAMASPLTSLFVSAEENCNPRTNGKPERRKIK